MSSKPMSREEVRSIDARAISQFHIPGVVLMENAGRGAAELLMKQTPTGSILICAGKGNNGGDGFVIARHLSISGHTVEVLLFCDPEEQAGDALINFQIIEASRIPIHVFGNQPNYELLAKRFSSAEWVVDALLGTGTQGELRDPFPQIIQCLNQSEKKVMAVDLPSGMDCDSGQPIGECVVANLTATFVAPKLGFTQPDAARFTGDVHVIGIGVPQAVLAQDE